MGEVVEVGVWDVEDRVIIVQMLYKLGLSKVFTKCMR